MLLRGQRLWDPVPEAGAWARCADRLRARWAKTAPGSDEKDGFTHEGLGSNTPSSSSPKAVTHPYPYLYLGWAST